MTSTAPKADQYRSVSRPYKSAVRLPYRGDRRTALFTLPILLRSAIKRSEAVTSWVASHRLAMGEKIDMTAEASTHIQKKHLTHLLRTYYTNYTKAHFQNSRKEVFQPHLPVRLPCYDLAPVTCITLGRPSRLRTLGTPDSHGLTGGVYKARERIHRAMADARLLANPASRSRVADSDPNCDKV